MNEKKRPIIGVVAAEASSFEQRQIIKGIAAQAMLCDMDTAVISNIYNAQNDDDTDEIHTENEIYGLMLSHDLDGIIFISESFVEKPLKEKIRDLLAQRRDIPVIAIGTSIPELSELDLQYINTDGTSDIEDLTDHLIDCHGFRDIIMITGPDEIKASHRRVEGYRRSLEKHGIPFDKAKVHIGNFWVNSGAELADKIAKGDIPKPEAVVCANDYMAYGMLDRFTELGVSVPDDITVVGYEYVHERIYHAPLLTTYQRNRYDLGVQAVNILKGRISGQNNAEFSPPRGTLIHGVTCPCKRLTESYYEELKTVKEANMYADWNITSPMDRQLTSCSNVDEFADVMSKNSFLVRYVQNIFLCLSEKWYDESTAEHDILACRSVLSWKDRSIFLINRYNFSRIFASSPTPAVYYFSPIFFGRHTFGYTVLKYEQPDTYDNVYKNWVKSISNALEFMRMKNDIRYFTANENLSEQYDSATGIYNAKGFEGAVRFATEKAEADKKAVIIMIKLITPETSVEGLGRQLTIYSEIADCLRILWGGSGDVCGRLERDIYGFAALGDLSEELADLLCDKLRLLVTFRSSCVKEWNLDSFVIASEVCDTAELDCNAVFARLRNELENREKNLAERHLIQGYSKFLRFRTKIYLDPEGEYPVEDVCQDFALSEGHFRKLYRSCFETSFHHDVLNSKIDHAKYLLCTTSLDTGTVSAKCGYIDPKYFSRIFRKCTSFTAKQYRDMFKESEA